MSKNVEHYPAHKKSRKEKILAKQGEIDKKNADDRAKALKKADDDRKKGIEARKVSNQKPAEEAPKLSLEEALKKLDPADDTHWTQAGLPDLTVLTELTGAKVARGDVPEDVKRPTE